MSSIPNLRNKIKILMCKLISLNQMCLHPPKLPVETFPSFAGGGREEEGDRGGGGSATSSTTTTTTSSSSSTMTSSSSSAENLKTKLKLHMISFSLFRILIESFFPPPQKTKKNKLKLYIISFSLFIILIDSLFTVIIEIDIYMIM